MKNNLSSTDKKFRTLLAVVLIILYATGSVGYMAGIILLSAAAILLATSMLSFCPLYSLFGIRTR